MFDSQKPTVILACSVISLGALLQHQKAREAWATSSEVELTLTKDMHLMLDKQTAVRRLASKAALQQAPPGPKEASRWAVGREGATGGRRESMGLKDIADAGLLPPEEEDSPMDEAGLAADGEGFDDLYGGGFFPSGDVLSQADMKVNVGPPPPAGASGSLVDLDPESGGAVLLTLTIRRLSVLDAAEQLHGIEPDLAQVRRLETVVWG